MALGGGTFAVQNKTLPGAYINFVSAASAGAEMSDRGYVAMGLESDWIPWGDQIFAVTKEDFQKRSLEIFGYDCTHPRMKGIRDIFKNAKMLYAYALGGSKAYYAENKYGHAQCKGIRGNDLFITIQKNLDNSWNYDVIVYLTDSGYVTDYWPAQVGDALFSKKRLISMNKCQEIFRVTTKGERFLSQVGYNDFVQFKAIELNDEALTAGTQLTGGKINHITGSDHTTFLQKLEDSGYKYNILATNTLDPTIVSLYTSYTRRMREEVGIKFQTVVPIVNYETSPDYEGIIQVGGSTASRTEPDSHFNNLGHLFWLAGAEAACPINKSLLNRVYDGEFEITTKFPQNILENYIKKFGCVVFHQVGESMRVLSDINSLITTTEEKGEVFKDNQTIRVIDQIADDIATLFNTKYLGIIPNDAGGRISFWTDLVKYHEQLQEIRAIENFSEDDIEVLPGDNKKSITVKDAVTVVNALAQLYMTVTVA